MKQGLAQIDFVVGADSGSGIENYIEDIRHCATQSNGYVLEIGVWRGTGSTVAIQQGLKDHPRPLHISIDQQDSMVWKPDAPWWHQVIADDRLPETLEYVRYLAEDRTPGVIYIDTNHDYEQMTAELAIWGPYAAADTLFLFHDTWLFGGYNEPMIRAIKEWGDPRGWIFEDWRKEMHGLGRMRHL